MAWNLQHLFRPKRSFDDSQETNGSSLSAGSNVKGKKMENALFIGLSKQMALRNQMEIVANNVANMNTSGFRAQNIMFHELVEDPKGQENDLSYVLDFGQYDNTDPGPVQHTGNPLDVAISGPGFMGVDNNGEIMYTRAGNFTVSANGTITNPSGMPVANQGGGPIVVPPGTQTVQITEDGMVIADEQQLGQLMLVEFENPQNLKPAGDVLYTTEDEPVPAANSVIKQFMLEGSNVNSIKEVTNMIEVLRSYQSVQSMIGDEDERQRTAVRELLRTQ